jgi:peptide/nickel transport system ATP-binding protein
MTEALVEVRDLTVRFAGADGPIAALNGVDFSVAAGEAMTILGESGSGKSVTLRALMRLLPPHRTTVSGTIRIGEHRMHQLDERTLAELRGTLVSMVFQEPMLAFDPVYTVGRQIVETIISSVTRGPTRRPPVPARANCWSACRSPRPNAAWAIILTRCRVACGSVR